MVVYIDVAEASNSIRFNVRMPCNLGDIQQRHTLNLLFYCPKPYLRASYHSVTIGIMKTIVFIGTTFSVNHCSILIQRGWSCLYQYLISYGPHFFPLFRRWCNRFRNPFYGGMMCVAWLSLPMRSSGLSVFIFVEDRYALMSCTQYVYFSLGRNTFIKRVWMSQTKHVLRSASQSYPSILRSERGLCCFSVSEHWSGLNIVWMTNKDEFLARSTQLGSSMLMVMI